MTTDKQLTTILKALKAYRTGAEVSPVLVEAGLASESKEMSHDAVITWVLQERGKAQRTRVVEQFITGVETNQAHLRAGLSAYASALHLPEHAFTASNQSTCQVCSAFREITIDSVRLNKVRFLGGSVLSGDIAQIAFFLEAHNASEVHPPQGVALTRSIFEMIRQLPGDATPTVMLKQLRKLPGVKMSEEQARCFIDLLGHCAILQTPEHPGLLYRFTNQGLAPTSSRSSDWSYPVDFWRGEHGINADAMNYWFGDYPELLAP